MSARPLIGLTTSQPSEDSGLGRLFNGTSRRYMEGLEAVETLPVLLPNLPELAESYARQLDAVLFTGGVDVHPRHFGQHPRRGLGTVDEGRDAFEIALYRAARQLGKPTFGICRGVQLLNVLEGGTLHQHLPDVPEAWVDHAQQASPPAVGHEVQFTPGSLLAECHGVQKVFVNSYHHQALDRLAPTLRCAAVAPDGIVEALEGEGLIAVQWHPELTFAAHPDTQGTFRAFRRLL
ncbi:gamma-glutamyl-gamma-aminobutyrate hydrolase family protein [Deinococcus cavernae]|uniref:Gamma-glutamyl-gamma-aminobutyrate hydrolase family protein n=1 Tax=Deinococcus cavernae TaxID=2320857 RepID=A0A418UZW4_9DEIO|nr:gamma-glutamyl-gamma-aminobutyrate hydrolase family protein [Deinococcus cavernae]RJF69011.1 gamma-glutamyl-gamma-aminobutyrate hydrolase family protein [Deinococcus cavernae]